MMNKKRLAPTVLCLILFAVVGIVLLTYMTLNPLTREYFIFQNIEECELLIPTDHSNAEIIRYDSPSKDKKLKGLPYNNFWAVKFESDTLEYEIFAYEFVDSDSALKYYINVTGKNSYEKNLPLKSEDENKLFCASRGMFFYEIVVIYQNKAYQIIVPNRYEDEVNNLLATAFSQQIF